MAWNRLREREVAVIVDAGDEVFDLVDGRVDAGCVGGQVRTDFLFAEGTVTGCRRGDRRVILLRKFSLILRGFPSWVEVSFFVFCLLLGWWPFWHAS